MLMLSLSPLQEDNHSYYVSRTYGPGAARRQGLWVDMAAADSSHVKVHGILSNTHRQASVSPGGPSCYPSSPWRQRLPHSLGEAFGSPQSHCCGRRG